MNEKYKIPKLDYNQLFTILPDRFDWVRFITIDGDGTIWPWEEGDEPNLNSILNEWESLLPNQYRPQENDVYLGSTFLYSNVPEPKDSLFER